MEHKLLRVRAYTLKEAEEIIHYAMRLGYEGVQNDSYRYCKESASCALRDGRCYICLVCNGGRGSLYVANGHDPKRKRYLEVSKSKFYEEIK